jgi:hypothetical protein
MGGNEVGAQQTVKVNNLLFLAAAILGYAAWVLPCILIAGSVECELPFMPTYLTDPKQANTYTLTGLSILGLLIGFFLPSNWVAAIYIGALMVAPLAILTTLEVVLGFDSHALFGIELFMYGLFTLPAIVAARIGSFVAKEIQERQPRPGERK